jgi:hypothetical protein
MECGVPECDREASRGKKEFAVIYRCAWENDSWEYLLIYLFLNVRSTQRLLEYTM